MGRTSAATKLDAMPALRVDDLLNGIPSWCSRECLSFRLNWCRAHRASPLVQVVNMTGCPSMDPYAELIDESAQVFPACPGCQHFSLDPEGAYCRWSWGHYLVVGNLQSCPKSVGEIVYKPEFDDDANRGGRPRKNASAA